MSLDFSILSESGRPLRAVPIYLDFYPVLIAAAESAESELILRMADYYEHARYEVSELPALAAELNALETARPHDPTFTEGIARLRELVEEAQTSSLRIMAIAD
jgi:hypothetical protein